MMTIQLARPSALIVPQVNEKSFQRVKCLACSPVNDTINVYTSKLMRCVGREQTDTESNRI